MMIWIFHFRAILGEIMQYTSGIYKNNSDSLGQAQNEKINLILKKSRLSDRSVNYKQVNHLDIGCGYATLCMEFAKKGAYSYGVSLSQSQISDGKIRIFTNGINNCCIARADWRDLTSLRVFPKFYDIITAICVLEHEGKAAYELLEFIYKHLAADGVFVMQGIVNTESVPGVIFDTPRDIGDQFLQGIVFPGSRIPKLWEVIDWTRRIGFHLDHIETFGMSYAKTCQAWADNLLENSDIIRHELRGLPTENHKKIRQMEIYLRICQRLFELRLMDVAQYVFTKQANPYKGLARL